MKRAKWLSVGKVAGTVVLGLAVCVVPVWAQGGGGGDGGDGGADQDIVGIVRSLAKMAIDILIGVATAVASVGVVAGFVGGELMVTLGQPYGISSTLMKVISVILLWLGAIFGIVLVNTVIEAIGDIAFNTDLPTLDY